MQFYIRLLEGMPTLVYVELTYKKIGDFNEVYVEPNSLYHELEINSQMTLYYENKYICGL